MTDIIDVSTSIIQPVVAAMVRSRGMDEDRRAHLVADALAAALNGSGFLMIQRECLERLNIAMLEAQALMRMQQAELNRLAGDGADVHPGLVWVMETVQ